MSEIKTLLSPYIRYGTFSLASGKTSPYYIDARSLISNPEGLKQVAEMFPDLSKSCSNLRVCGVPYGAVPLATAYSLRWGVPQVVLRKEPKKYGLQKLLEGEWEVGDNILLMDDIWTTGSSMREAKQQLESLGLTVVAQYVVVCREIPTPPKKVNYPKRVNYLIFGDELLDSPLYRFRSHLSLFQKDSKPALCLACDVTDQKAIYPILDHYRGELAVVKLHPELIRDWDKAAIKKMRNYADRDGFWIWVDAKLCDVKHILCAQLEFYEWADLVSVMSIVDEDAMKALGETAKKCNLSLIVVNKLYTEGKCTWSDEKSHFTYPESVVATVGTSVYPYVHIRAGVSDDSVTDCDLLVRGRSLIRSVK